MSYQILSAIKGILDEIKVLINDNNKLLEENKRLSDRVAEGSCLENRHTRDGIVGSNPTSTSIPDQHIRMKEVMKLIGVSRPTIWRWEKKKKFPKKINIGSNTVAYRRSDIVDWLNNKHKMD